MLYNVIIFFATISFYYAGLKFPDIDLKLKNFGITHRSITYSLILYAGISFVAEF